MDRFHQRVINLPCGLDEKYWNKGPCFANVKARIISVHLPYPLVLPSLQVVASPKGASHTRYPVLPGVWDENLTSHGGMQS